MMGTKVRLFAPLHNVSLEDVVPNDHFYHHVERTLDLTFVRDLVRACYVAGGRPSIDPVVFFKLQLIMLFEGIRSERQLMQVAADRLSYAGISAMTCTRHCRTIPVDLAYHNMSVVPSAAVLGQDYPRLQILTIDELLHGAEVNAAGAWDT